MDGQSETRPLLWGPDLSRSPVLARALALFREACLSLMNQWIDRAISDPEARAKLKALAQGLPAAELAKLRGEIEAFACKARRMHR
jgi:hypothetical protein